jgi:ubiquinone/menaquinone biosynthesis C-methylase UbiE
MDAHVPGEAHYDASYLVGWRLHSIAEQVALALAVRPSRVLEIGVGTGLSAHALRTAGIEVVTADVQPDLEPDIVADVRSLPVEGGAFDVACCCQVLEHLPFAEFGPAVAELRRVTRRRLVLSLPDIERPVHCSFRAPLVGSRELAFSLPAGRVGPEWRRDRLETMGHYWEIGVDGISARVVRDAIRSAGFRTIATHRLRENPWHRFYVAE